MCYEYINPFIYLFINHLRLSIHHLTLNYERTMKNTKTDTYSQQKWNYHCLLTNGKKNHCASICNGFLLDLIHFNDWTIWHRINLYFAEKEKNRMLKNFIIRFIWNLKFIRASMVIIHYIQFQLKVWKKRIEFFDITNCNTCLNYSGTNKGSILMLFHNSEGDEYVNYVHVHSIHICN